MVGTNDVGLTRADCTSICSWKINVYPWIELNTPIFFASSPQQRGQQYSTLMWREYTERSSRGRLLRVLYGVHWYMGHSRIDPSGILKAKRTIARRSRCRARASTAAPPTPYGSRRGGARKRMCAHVFLFPTHMLKNAQ